MLKVYVFLSGLKVLGYGIILIQSQNHKRVKSQSESQTELGLRQHDHRGLAPFSSMCTAVFITKSSTPSVAGLIDGMIEDSDPGDKHTKAGHQINTRLQVYIWT